jgi:hypothetical protein
VVEKVKELVHKGKTDGSDAADSAEAAVEDVTQP